MKLRLLFLGSLTFLTAVSLKAQPDRWQQRAEYKMEVELNAQTNQFTGNQKLTYFNNSTDTLTKVFYHLYFNAFQPNSMMDVRSRTIADPDRRVSDRIANLKPDEYGYLHVTNLKQDGKSAKITEEETILEVILPKPLLPGKKTVISLDFEGQVPLQVRRSGRDNAEGIRYSMTQWYPKLAEYDYEGWHANPYIGREFYGVWGDFDVKITLDSDYTVAASGYLQNADKIGHGYTQNEVNGKKDKHTWHFKAPNVTDFAWAADTDYVHDIAQVPNGPTLHFFYKPNQEYSPTWKELQPYTVKAFEVLSRDFGKYPYETYSVIQGGDGGMEYAMATLITGNRSLRSLVGVTVHEAAHSWYQMVLGTNESLYPWIDEGFTSYASNHTMNLIFEQGNPNPNRGSITSYLNLAKSGDEEPLTTHADHYTTNRAYGIASYSKGATMLSQLSYIVGDEVMMKGMRRYFNTWKFKHPNPTDFKRIMEKTSGLELDWFFLNFVGTINTIDYKVSSVMPKGENGAVINLERVGEFPMPLDVLVSYTDGSQEVFYVPLAIMRGEKDKEFEVSTTTLPDWPWVYPNYTFELSKPISQIQQIIVDPSQRMADIEPENNIWPGTSNAATYQAKPE